MNLSQDRMHKGLDCLEIRSEDFFAAQIVGTNGKGSTACFLESLARNHGLKTGLFTSPHLVSVKERIRAGNQELSDLKWLEAAGEVLARCQGLELTYFELLTLISVLIFSRENVDLAVMEAGLGGRHDATSALGSALVVFTPAGLDHTDILGNTLAEIARDKSMAAKKGPMVVAEQDPEAMSIFKSRAEDIGGVFYPVRECFSFEKDYLQSRLRPGLKISLSGMKLHGPHQVGNAAAALLAWQVLADIKGIRIDPYLCSQALKNAFWPGRLHIVRNAPLIILDGAHNQPAMKALKNALEDMDISPRDVVFSCLRDKDVEALAGYVNAMNPERVLIPEIDHPRAFSREELTGLFGRISSPLARTRDYFLGLESDHGPVLVCGSLYLLGQIYSEFPEWLGVD